MTDQMIPADKVREIIARHRDGASHRGGMILDDLKALLDPTLADMTDEEQDSCQWMQADVTGHDTRYVITTPDDGDDEAVLIAPDGRIDWIHPSLVTPRPDLPRLEWPDDKKAAPALPGGWRLADHKDYGRVMVTNTTPNRDGYIYCVYSSDRDRTGFDWHYCDPDELTYIDQEADAAPPNTLAVGSVWGDIDALTTACETSGRGQIVVVDCEGDVSVWSADAGWWEAGMPSDGYEPYTIIHTGRKADQ